MATCHQFRREAAAARKRAEAALTLATEHGFAYHLAYSMILRGWALAYQGQSEEGRAQVHQGLAACQSTGTEEYRTHFLAVAAQADGSVGCPEAGLRLLAEALMLVEKTGERFWEAELHRLQGELILRLASPDAVQVETCFRHALNIARRQQARSLELRAAMSLARLWQSQSKHAEAYALLAPVYGWFTEGFNTTDLQEAQALLEALR